VDDPTNVWDPLSPFEPSAAVGIGPDFSTPETAAESFAAPWNAWSTPMTAISSSGVGARVGEPVDPSIWDPIDPMAPPGPPNAGPQTLIEPLDLDAGRAVFQDGRAGFSVFQREQPQVPQPVEIGHAFGVDAFEELENGPDSKRGPELKSVGPSFSVEGVGRDLHVTHKPPAGLRLAPDEDLPTMTTKPFEDLAAERATRLLNGFHAKVPQTEKSEMNYGRPYDSGRAVPAPFDHRAGSRRLRPVAGRVRLEAKKCPRCGDAMDGNRCGRCDASFCDECKTELSDGLCANSACWKNARCAECGQVPCTCNG
jgi:hypothetical protein